MTNEMDVALELPMHERPYFGPLVAVARDGTALMLPHDEDPDHGVVETKAKQISEDDSMPIISLEAGETLEDWYRLPDSLPDRSRIWLHHWLFNEGLELLDRSYQAVSWTLSIESSGTPT